MNKLDTTLNDVHLLNLSNRQHGLDNKQTNNDLGYQASNIRLLQAYKSVQSFCQDSNPFSQ